MTDEAQVRSRVGDYAINNLTPDEAFALYDDARRSCPVARSEQLGGFHLLTRYEDVKRATSEWQTFSNEPYVTRPIVEERMRIVPLEFDPPQHDWWRRLFKQTLDARAASRVEDAVRADVNATIDAFAARGECDLIADFAVPVPLHTLCLFLGIDVEKGPEFRRLVSEMQASQEDPESSVAAVTKVVEWGTAEVVARRENPRDDVLSELGQLEVDGRRLEVMEIGILMVSLLVAGHDTTVSALSTLLRSVLSDDELRRRLVDDPSLIPAAVDENLRLHPPFVGLFRRVTGPVELSGVTLAEGDSVQVCWAAANRDGEVFQDPDSFRLDRGRGANQPLTFGYGIHACPGQLLARTEMRIALAELLRRLPDIQLVDPDAARAAFVGLNTEIASMPATFSTPTAKDGSR